MLGSEHAERHAEAGVGPGREDPEGLPGRRARLVGDGHLELGALGAADPVALLRDDPVGPLDEIEVVEQLLRVVGDLEKPLLEIPLLDGVARPFAQPVLDLLVGEHGVAARAPVDGRLGAVRQAGLEETQEDPLCPADVFGVVAADLAAPVVHAADPGDGGAQELDPLVGEAARMTTGLDRGVLGREPEAVEPHRREDGIPLHRAVPGQQITEGVVANVSLMRGARRVRVHREDVGAPTFGETRVVVVDLVGVVGEPTRLPQRFDLGRTVRERVGATPCRSFGHDGQTTEAPGGAWRGLRVGLRARSRC